MQRSKKNQAQTNFTSSHVSTLKIKKAPTQSTKNSGTNNLTTLSGSGPSGPPSKRKSIQHAQDESDSENGLPVQKRVRAQAGMGRSQTSKHACQVTVEEISDEDANPQEASEEELG